MASFDVAKLLNKITQDIPGINTVLKALAKWDVSALTDVPDGAMQATTDTNNRLTIKKKVSGAYTPVVKLMHDVDMVDGYHASASATANTVAVRNASGALPGNILGNAATANTASALAAGAVVPVNQGGTGATTASQARTNLGAANGADFTAHIAKQASPSVEGHVKLDALAADGSNTAAPGGFGLGVEWPATQTDYNLLVKSGFYRMDKLAINGPNWGSRWAFLLVLSSATGSKFQVLYEDAANPRVFMRRMAAGVWQSWIQLPNGVTDSVSTTSSTTAASATAVKSVNDNAVHLAGTETITGAKTIKNSFKVLDSQQFQQRSDCVLGTTPSALVHYNFDRLDATGAVIGQFQTRQDTSNNVYSAISCVNKKSDGVLVPSRLRCWSLADGTAYAECPTPPANATSSQIATAEWVLSHSNAEQVGDVFASLAATRPGCLLMNGGAVSRATYANLFALIGTMFGEGNGTTTFNLPNFRDKTFWGASPTFPLGAVVPSGLPDIYGRLPLHLSDPNSTAGGAFYVEGSYTTGTSTNGRNAWRDIRFRASRDNAIFGASPLVRPPSIAVNFFIKY